MKGFRGGDANINRKGRPLKAINKVSRPLKMRISDFLDEKFNELPSIWNKLAPKDKVGFLRDLIPFVVARMTSVDMELNLQNLSDEDLDRIVERLMNKPK